jgi:hypothetical protein
VKTNNGTSVQLNEQQKSHSEEEEDDDFVIDYDDYSTQTQGKRRALKSFSGSHDKPYRTRLGMPLSVFVCLFILFFILLLFFFIYSLFYFLFVWSYYSQIETFQPLSLVKFNSEERIQENPDYARMRKEAFDACWNNVNQKIEA